MTLVEIYRCLSDETRLRIMHLLNEGALCVCHFQAILEAPQVAISKQLAYLRRHGLVEARRHGQWKIYQVREPRTPELSLQLDALAHSVKSDDRLQEDLKRHRKVHGECDWISQVPARKKRARKR